MSVMKVLLFSVVFFLVASRTVLSSETTYESIYKQYTKEDENYGAKPINRFLRVGEVTRSPCEGKIAGYIKSTSLASDMVRYNLEFINCFTFGYEAIAFIGINVDLSVSSEERNKAVPFYHGFVYIDFQNRVIGSTQIDIDKVDLEIGGYSRSLWDVVEREQHKYLLVLLREYESYSFELYKIKKTGLQKVDMYYIGGL